MESKQESSRPPVDANKTFTPIDRSCRTKSSTTPTVAVTAQRGTMKRTALNSCDTNTGIRYLNGQSESIKTRLEQLRPEEVVLCSVVKAELLCGAAKSNAGERAWTASSACSTREFGRIGNLKQEDWE